MAPISHDLKTDRLIPRPFEPSDLEAMAAYYSLPDVQRYLAWTARARLAIKAALASMRQQTPLTRPGDTLTLAVILKGDGLRLGQVSLRWTDATAAQAEIRFVFNPLYHRQGYAT